LLFLIEVVNDRAMSIRLFAEKSTFLRPKSERELPLVGRFSISYRRQWKKSFATKNFTWSNGNNPRKFSQNLRRPRLKQKGGRDCRPRPARDLDVHGFFRDLLGYVRAAAKSNRKRN
jgi:hypothetical protein